MPATLSVIVFVFAAGISMAALAQSWVAYGQAALALRDGFPGIDDRRELRFIVTQTAPRGATILRPDFSRKLRGRPACPALRAAA